MANKKLSKLNLPVFASGNENFENLPETEKKKVNEVSTFSYIATDLTVMGLAGFLAGALFGIFFIGVSFDKKGWPGMAAFIVLSLLGSSMY